MRKPRVILEMRDMPYRIALAQNGRDDFTVHYGMQCDFALTYAEASAKLGAAIMHALACKGEIRDA